MSLLIGRGLTQQFGAKSVFRGIEVRLEKKQRVGLVGPNGSGKTTLLQGLAKSAELSAGTVEYAPFLTVGYLPQEALWALGDPQQTVYEAALAVFASLRADEQRLRLLEEAMARGEGVLEEYATIQARYEQGGGYDYPTEIKLVLLGLGFLETMWQQPIAQLSGGEKTRLLLGRLLLEKRDLLILDEPTNHLDVQTIEWLEGFLRKWQGALLIVSHDRYFLDRVVNQIWELRPTELRVYKGDYTHYLHLREERFLRELTLFEVEKGRLSAELDYVQKNIAGGDADNARGRLRRISRDLYIMQKWGVTALQNKAWIEIGERTRSLTVGEAVTALRQLQPPEDRPISLNITLQTKQKSDQLVLWGSKIAIGYHAARPMFQLERVYIERGERIVIVGKNGSGKTTLLRALVGAIPLLQGVWEYGEKVQCGYFAQGHEQLDPHKRVIDQLIAEAPMTIEQARALLGRYLFRGEAVFQRVNQLSGGERGRLALAILATTGANLLFLDEPTNHLDIPSQEVLQAVLEQYDGTMVLVSHDRYLINRVATQIWEVDEGKVTIYEGKYAFYLERKSAERAQKEASNLPPPDLSWLQELEEEREEAFLPEPPEKKEWGQRLGELERWLDEGEARLAELELQEATARDFGLIEEAELYSAEIEELRQQVAIWQAEWERLLA